MSEQEERLWFFENEENIDLQINKLERGGAFTEKRLTKKISAKNIDDAYIPPEVGVKRN